MVVAGATDRAPHFAYDFSRNLRLVYCEMTCKHCRASLYCLRDA